MNVTHNMLTKKQLIDDLKSACKPLKEWRIGCEHEVFLFDTSHKRLFYNGNPGVEDFLKAFQHNDWKFVKENNQITGLQNFKTKQSVSLEPGGQMEFADCPQKNLHDVFESHLLYWEKLDQVASDLNVFLKYEGLDNIKPIDKVPWMPKERYNIMKRHMINKGSHGLWMMTKTCTAQVSLDFESEQDMIQKFRISLAIQPIVSAMFANSAFFDHRKKFTGYRSYIWQNTDFERCGILPFVFEKTFCFERYVDYILSVPMYFVKRDQYIDCRGGNFKNFMEGKLHCYPHNYATFEDWYDQLTICFPEVRLKHYIEQRGADCNSRDMIIALPALWVGLLYNIDNLNFLTDMIREWSFEDVNHLYHQVPYQGLNACIYNQNIFDIAKILIERAEKGLESRHLKNDHHHLETIYLDALKDKFCN